MAAVFESLGVRYLLGGSMAATVWSEQQWRDVAALIRTLGDELDWACVQGWAERLGIHGLVERARREANA